MSVGNTAMVASYIKEYTKADSFEIVPVMEYPKTYDECSKVANNEKENDTRPKIKSKIENLDSYDTIFIGYPIWCEDLPMIMYTFLEENDFNGKNVYLFNTHGGSDDAGTYSTIQSKLSSANVNVDGHELEEEVARTEEGKNEIIKWLEKLDY